MKRQQVLKEIKKGLLLGLSLGFVLLLLGDLHLNRQIGKTVVSQMTKVDLLIHYIKQAEVINNERLLNMLKSDIVLTESVTDLYKQVNKIKTQPNFQKLIKANVTIINEETTYGGSGTIIKYKDKLYVLSCAHLDGEFSMRLDGEQHFKKLKLIKIDKEKDLLLFELPKDLKNINYIEISTETPNVGDKVWVIGNPVRLDDIITTGIISKHQKGKYLISAPIYFGNSGGAVVNQEGKLIGVTHALMISFYEKKGIILTGIAIDLETVTKFLDGGG